MNTQEIFDRVTLHLIHQGERAFDQYFGCRYREASVTWSTAGLLVNGRVAGVTLKAGNNKVRTCAIGCLIPEDQYSNLMEGMSVSSLIHSYPSLGLLPDDHGPHAGVNFLAELQTAHDSVDHWDRTGFNEVGRRALRRCAHLYGLDDMATRA